MKLLKISQLRRIKKEEKCLIQIETKILTNNLEVFGIRENYPVEYYGLRKQCCLLKLGCDTMIV